MNTFFDNQIKLYPKQFSQVNWELCSLLLDYPKIDRVLVKLMKPNVVILEFDDCFYLKNIVGEYFSSNDEKTGSLFMEKDIKLSEINLLISNMQDVITEYSKQRKIIYHQFEYFRKEIRHYVGRYYR
jgi:hypothetical protein